MTLITGLRLPVTAFTVASVQALLVDQADIGLIRHLDLPLAVTIALVMSRPASAVVTGFVFGLAVDLFHTRLFGLHGVAYAMLGLIAATLPVGALRSRAEIVASSTAVHASAATALIAAGGWVTGNGVAPGIVGRFVQVVLWSLVIVVPLTAVLGARMGLTTPDRPGHLDSPSSAEWVR